MTMRNTINSNLYKLERKKHSYGISYSINSKWRFPIKVDVESDLSIILYLLFYLSTSTILVYFTISLKQIRQLLGRRHKYVFEYQATKNLSWMLNGRKIRTKFLAFYIQFKYKYRSSGCGKKWTNFFLVWPSDLFIRNSIS